MLRRGERELTLFDTPCARYDQESQEVSLIRG